MLGGINSGKSKKESKKRKIAVALRGLGGRATSNLCRYIIPQ